MPRARDHFIRDTMLTLVALVAGVLTVDVHWRRHGLGGVMDVIAALCAVQAAAMIAALVWTFTRQPAKPAPAPAPTPPPLAPTPRAPQTTALTCPRCGESVPPTIARTRCPACGAAVEIPAGLAELLRERAAATADLERTARATRIVATYSAPWMRATATVVGLVDVTVSTAAAAHLSRAHDARWWPILLPVGGLAACILLGFLRTYFATYGAFSAKMPELRRAPAETIACVGCGAALTLARGRIAATCLYCGTAHVRAEALAALEADNAAAAAAALRAIGVRMRQDLDEVLFDAGVSALIPIAIVSVLGFLVITR